ncbi:MAG: hypothetical protein KDA21_04890 [Phycisphaerales bacterium]|nr:hypothetical protein [Phycisphaerales bacterium]
MTQMNRVLRRAAIRMALGRFGLWLLLALTLAAAAMLGVRVADKLIGFQPDWNLAWIIAGSSAATLALIATILTRKDRLFVARTVDENANLREALSTALCVADRTDSWSRAAVAHAAEVANRVIIRQAFPFRIPRLWPAPLVLLGLFFLAGLVPQGDLLGFVSKAEAEEQHQEEVAAATQEVKQIDKTIEDLMEKLGDDAFADQLAEEELEKPLPLQDPEEMRRRALEKLTKAQQRVQELSDSEEQKTLDSMQQRMKNLKQLRDGSQEMADLSRALQKSDFGDAKEALEKMMEKLAANNMSPEDQQKLAEQLENLGKQLEELARNQDALEKALKEAGVDPAAMNNPLALQQAIQNSDKLSDAQKQQLQQLAQAQQQASQACQQMAQACQNAGQCMNPGQNAGNAQEGLGQMGQQLSQLEALQQQMSEMQMANQQIQNQLNSLCQSMGQCEGSSLAMCNTPGNGTGKRGLGGGFAPDDQAAAFNQHDEKAPIKTTAGRVIGTTLIEGDQVRGEAVQQFREQVSQAAQAFDDEAIETQTIPREFHDPIKAYFGNLDKQTRIESADKPAEEKKPESGN